MVVDILVSCLAGMSRSQCLCASTRCCFPNTHDVLQSVESGNVFSKPCGGHAMVLIPQGRRAPTGTDRSTRGGYSALANQVCQRHPVCEVHRHPTYPAALSGGRADGRRADGTVGEAFRSSQRLFICRRAIGNDVGKGICVFAFPTIPSSTYLCINSLDWSAKSLSQ